MSKKACNSCLCVPIKKVLFICRTCGIWPITARQGNGVCTFFTTKKRFIYSTGITVIYCIYTLVTYIAHIFCNEHKKTDWYIMSTGYFLTDLDSLIAIILSVYYRKRIARVLEVLAAIKSPLTHFKKITQNINKFIVKLAIYVLIIFASYIYVAIWRFNNLQIKSFSCSILDTSVAVVLRGFTVIFPTLQILFIYSLCTIIIEKLDYLAELTHSTVESYQQTLEHENATKLSVVADSFIQQERNKWNYSNRVNSAIILDLETENIFEQSSKSTFFQLFGLAEVHAEIFNCINELNACNGFQLLIEICSCLYATVYYLYRYFTSSDNTTGSNMHDRIHYILSLSYRIFRLIIYMKLGEKLYTRSKLPLKGLLRSKLLKLPIDVQQQIQTLIQQFQGEEGYLSGFGVVRIGPWLLAPIVGNIITYLLVALQFRRDD